MSNHISMCSAPLGLYIRKILDIYKGHLQNRPIASVHTTHRSIQELQIRMSP